MHPCKKFRRQKAKGVPNKMICFDYSRQSYDFSINIEMKIAEKN